MRIVFIGMNWKYSLVPLHALLKNHDVVGIVESPWRGEQKEKAGLLRKSLRKMRRSTRKFLGLGPLPRLSEIARDRVIPYIRLSGGNQSELVDFLKMCMPHAVCVCSMNQLLKQEALAVPQFGTLNVHPSVLPKYRGPFPWLWQSLEMDLEGGVTVHFIDEGADTGNILRQEKYAIPLGAQFSEQLDATSRLAAKNLLEALTDAAEGKTGTPQGHLPCPVYARRVKPGEEVIQWNNWPIERVWHALRGTQRWIKHFPGPAEGEGFYWSIGEFSKEKTAILPGTVAQDVKGFFAAHPEGKIRLYVQRDPLFARSRILERLSAMFDRSDSSRLNSTYLEV